MSQSKTTIRQGQTDSQRDYEAVDDNDEVQIISSQPGCQTRKTRAQANQIRSSNKSAEAPIKEEQVMKAENPMLKSSVTLQSALPDLEESTERDEKQNMKQELQQERGAVERLQVTHSRVITGLQEAYEIKVDALSREVNNLASEKSKLEKKLVRQANDIEKSDEVKRLNRRNKSLERTLQERKALFDTKKAEATGLKAKQTRLEKKNDKLDAENKRLLQKSRSKDPSYGAGNDDSRHVKKLESENRQLSNKNSQLESSNRQYEELNGRLEVSQAELKEDNRKLTAELFKLQQADNQILDSDLKARVCSLASAIRGWVVKHVVRELKPKSVAEADALSPETMEIVLRGIPTFATTARKSPENVARAVIAGQMLRIFQNPCMTPSYQPAKVALNMLVHFESLVGDTAVLTQWKQLTDQLLYTMTNLEFERAIEADVGSVSDEVATTFTDLLYINLPEPASGFLKSLFVRAFKLFREIRAQKAMYQLQWPEVTMFNHGTMVDQHGNQVQEDVDIIEHAVFPLFWKVTGPNKGIVDVDNVVSKAWVAYVGPEVAVDAAMD